MNRFRVAARVAVNAVPALLLPCLMMACVPKKGAVAPGGGASGAADSAHNLLKASSFDDGVALPWTPSFPNAKNGGAAIENGAYCMTVNDPGTSPWDAQVRHREMVIRKGHSYSISFKIWSDKPTKVRPKLGMAGPPYLEYWRQDLSVTAEPQTITGQFMMEKDDDPTAEFAIHAGGQLATSGSPYKVCIDDIVLSDPQFTPPPVSPEPPPPAVRTNQIGYLPNGSKLATIAEPSSAPIAWTLTDAQGNVKMSGETLVFGQDQFSGEHVHVVDFTAVTDSGDGFVLSVGDAVSFPFRIAKDIYSTMKVDALRYFYHNRSGIAIEMPYAGDAKWARPAGHLNSDAKMGCAKDFGCDYTLDVTGGWYDAGDHGKYVVNGGISLWTLLDLFETTKYLGGKISELGDGKLNIPESRNGVPDILDEARWEMQWMMKMQVPDGKPNAGMAHHKVHDLNWTALGIAPHEAETKMQRALRPVSTAATLNLAATGGMCARIWKKIDAQFSQKCLIAAEKAWRAAKANPSKFAVVEDTNGGGPYNDNKLADDFYWAASELFIATGKDEYKKEILSSPSHNTFPMGAGGATASMTWDVTDALGKISLAVVPNQLGAPAVKQLRDQIVKAANEYLKMIDKTGYRIPFYGAPDGTFPWGSNSFILNNMVITALAYDFTKQRKYFEGVSAGMGYLMGRNPLAQSYVTGHGQRPLKHPHHRFWANQVDSRYPEAPSGAISGGPNSGLQDPYAQAAGLPGCAPSKCFVDNIEAWSTNEITINWNAPFAWLLYFLDENAK